MTILFVIIGLSILILGHEVGHFFAAKLLKIKVEEFGFGLPPAIFKKKIGKTVYSINALPFGGFVKMANEDGEDRSFAEQSGDSSRREEYNTKEEKERMGEVVEEEVVYEEEKTENGTKFLFFAKIKRTIPFFRKEEAEEGFSEKAIWKRAVVLFAGVFMNVVLGWIFLSFVFMAGIPQKLLILEVAKNSPAEQAGIKKDDVVIGLKYQGVELKDPIQGDAFANTIKSAGNNEIELTILRGFEKISIKTNGRTNPPVGEGSLGVGFAPVGAEKQTILKSFASGFGVTIDAIKGIVNGFILLFSKLFVSRELVEGVSGPVGIFAFASNAGSLGFVYLFQLIALISLNLAVLNIIPFPALDGGRILFLLIEKIKGSPISKKIQMGVNTVGFGILILLMILITIKDVGALIK